VGWRRALTILVAFVGLVLVAMVVRPGAPKNRVSVTPDGGGPGWDVYLVGAATKEEGERLGRHLLERVQLANGRGGAVALERPAAGGVVVALFLDPAEIRELATMTQADRLRDELARSVFPGEALALQVCRGPMSYGPGDVPVRDVVVTLR
jgi:hypothetical protein